MSSIPSLPNDKAQFFIIGAQRCGTTYLYELLEEHPQVAMAQPKRPEPKWFLDPKKAALGGVAWEKNLFGGAPKNQLGEKGTSYIEFPGSARAILDVFPVARFLVMLRNPVARAVSNYQFSVENHLENLPIEQALTPEAEDRPFDRGKMLVSPFTYLKRSRYADTLSAWASSVPPGRLYPILLEELLADSSVLEGLFRFLGVEPFDPPSRGLVVNASIDPVPIIPESVRRRLEGIFEEPNRRLELLLGRNLDLWKR